MAASMTRRDTSTDAAMRVIDPSFATWTPLKAPG
jgi:hypothetical protein